jgi:hypothetical protein
MSYSKIDTRINLIETYNMRDEYFELQREIYR